MMDILTLGEKIKLKRREMNLTLKDLAGNRITPGQISLVESGKSKPSIDLLEYLAEKLDTDIEYFLESEEKQAARISEFYANIAEAAISNKDILRAKEAIEKGKVYAEKYKISYYKGVFALITSNLKLIQERYDEAQQYCLSANAIFLKIHSVDKIVKSFILLGIITYRMNCISIALSYFVQADNVLREYNHFDEFFKTQIYFNTALCHKKLGNHNLAVDYALLAKDRLKVLDDKRAYGETLMILSISYGKEDNVKEALKYAREAKKIFNEVNDIKELSDIESTLGVIFSRDENMDESFYHLNRALDMKKTIKDDSAFDTLLNICDNYIKQNAYNEALQLIADAMEGLRDEQDIERLKCMEYQFRIYYSIGDKLRAEEVLLRGVKYAENLDYKKELANLYITLGKFYTEIDEKELALNNINKGVDLYKEMGVINDKEPAR